MKDLTNKEDVKLLVDTFYGKIQGDDLLAPIFALRIMPSDWSAHLQRMYDFWNTVLFFEHSYRGNPFSKHAWLPIEQKHFDQWVLLFTTTIDQHFEGNQADKMKEQARKMAHLFQAKKKHMDENTNYKSII